MIVDPIKFNDSFALSLTLGCVSDNVSDNLVTINGKQTLNYFGEQYAILPKAQILATLALHYFSLIPSRSKGKTYLTPYPLKFYIAYLVVLNAFILTSSELSPKNFLSILNISNINGSISFPKISFNVLINVIAPILIF